MSCGYSRESIAQQVEYQRIHNKFVIITSLPIYAVKILNMYSPVPDSARRSGDTPLAQSSYACGITAIILPRLHLRQDNPLRGSVLDQTGP
jgi:hypothetical protein